MQFFRLLIFLLAFVSSLSGQSVFVSPSGSDTNSGSSNAPVRTFMRAAELARDNNINSVIFAGGEYLFEETAVLDPSFNGITFQAAAGEKPVFSSLKKVTNWSVFKGNILVASLPEGIGHVRYLQDKSEGWMERSATLSFSTDEPAGGEDDGCIECNSYTETTQEDLSNIRFPQTFQEIDWKRIEQYDLRANTLPWHMEVLPLESIDIRNRRLYTAIPALYDLRRDFNEPQPNAWILNTLEGIDEPGEWACLDGKIYLYPKSGTEDIYVPVLTELIRLDNGIIDGNSNFSAAVRDIAFDGITFTGGDFRIMKEDDVTVQHDWMVVDEPDALLRIRNASNIKVRNCHFTKTGGTGLRLDRFAQQIEIDNNIFSNLGRGGINVAGRGPGYGDVSKNNIIKYNYLEKVGMEKWASVAILLDNSSNNYVHHNYITDTYFSGIVVTGPRQLMFAGQAEGVADFYQGREFHFFEMEPSILEFMEANGGVLEGSQEAMKFVYNYNNRIEENALIDVCTGKGVFINGQIYVSGFQISPSPQDVKTNYFERNYLYDSYNHGINDYAIYSDSDQDDCYYTGNMIHGVSNGDGMPFDLPVILAFNQWAETENFGLGKIHLTGNLSEAVSYCSNGEEADEECTHTLGAILDQKGNIINGSGGSIELMELYQEMFLAICDDNFPQVTVIPGAQSIRERLADKIMEFGGTVPDCGNTCSNCDSCDDNIQNGAETGIDCGGPDCVPCAADCPVPVELYADNIQRSRVRLNWSGSGEVTSYRVQIRFAGQERWYSFTTRATFINVRGISSGKDFEWRVQSTCSDSESDWSSICTFTGNDPESGVCSGSAPTCEDGLQNGDETGVDCGGSDCAPCEPVPTCEDGLQNGDETGVDCGGPDCAPCEAAPTCGDGIQNGDETGIDCGGSDCEPCSSCSSPQAIYADNISRSRARLNWEEVASADQYLVEVRIVGSNRWYSLRTSRNEVTVRGIANGRNYEWRVTSICDGEAGEPSVICSFTGGDASSGTCGNALRYPDTLPQGVSNIKVYPNPARELLRVILGEEIQSEKNKATLRDLQGRVQLVEVFEGKFLEMNVLSLPRGVYILEVDNHIKTDHLKIILN